ncbi:MAG: hypothetical protein HZA80_02205 [Candidatus Taylorbacteria bacterium]|nr:hypothetical protein [Candidatus Taylorbacteria bacterium]
MLAATILIVLGVGFLLKNLGVLPNLTSVNWFIYWPVLLIIVGVVMIVRRRY